MNALPTGTVTFLFTDIEGSTKLLTELGRERYANVLAAHHALLRDAFAAREGTEVDTEGDAFFVAFGRASNAVVAAAEVQKSLARHSWPHGEPLRVRIGIHTGEASVHGDNYVGIAVHRAARIVSAAHGGQVLVSQATAELVADEPPHGLTLRDLGEHRLKDLSQPQPLFQLAGEGLESHFPPPRTLENRPTNLPVQPTPLIGRRRELAELRELISRSECQLVTLTGPGGAGKTRLALQTAAELVEDFPHGVFFVALATLSDPQLVLPSIVQTLGVRDQGEESVEEQLKSFLGDRTLLLLLDNFEQVIEAASGLAPVLAAAPHLKVLVTSRAALHLSGEREFLVPALALPELRHGVEIDTLTQYESVALFLERAQAAKRDFCITAENAPAIAELCVRLDGLPLAIELAAARVKLLPPEAMLRRLGERMKLLTGGARDLPARQQTLRAAIDWSYGLLTPDEQRLFARLAVFSGGCSLEAVESICGPENEVEVDALEGLASLVDKSLLRQVEETGEPRFAMLETIHEFARDKLQATDELGAARERHAWFFHDLAVQAEPNLAGPTLGIWLERLAADHANLRAAVEWFLAADRPDAALTTAVALADYLEPRGLFAEGRRWLSEALARQQDVPAALHARATFVLGRLVDSQAEFGEARRLYEEALATYQGLGDPKGVAEATTELAWAVLQQGDLDEAQRLGEHALGLARELGDPVVIAGALVNHGATLLELGRHAEALGCFEESLALRRPLGEARAVAVSLACIGWASFVAGDLARARGASEEAVDIMRSNADRQWVAASLHTLGSVALAEGALGRAVSLFAEALADAREMGDRRAAQECLVGLSAVAALEGDDEAAARLDGAAEALFVETGLAPSPVAVSIRRDQLAAAKDRMGDERWERERDAGRRLSLDELAPYASA